MCANLEQLLGKLAFHPISLLPLLIFLIFLYKWKSTTTTTTTTTKPNTPPSPPKLPIIGNLHQLGTFPHRSLRTLSQKYSELMLLHLGSRRALVVSCPSAAKEILKTHDIIFANRPKLHFVSKIFYGGNEIAFTSYGEHWRYLKSIATGQLLSSKSIQSFRSVREEEVALMVQKIKALASASSSCVNLSAIILQVVNDVISRTALGRKYSNDFAEIFKEFSQVLGAISIGDFIPWLGWIDRITGLGDRTEKVGKAFDVFFNEVIQDHQAAQNNGEKINDFVDLLLQIHEENPAALSSDSIKGLLLDIFAGSIETTYTVLEWTMTELLKHPRVMKKLQEEVRKTVKSKEVGVTEDDLKNMTYLMATIKEALRLHLPGPLLAFRESSNDVNINGYNIAAGTIVIVNAWAIQRDPNFWEDPEEFRPERFLNSSIDFKGNHFEFIPFGAGRRLCPGMLYSITMLQLLLACLLYEFDWELPDRAAPETLDMAEHAGLSIHKLHPLILVATPYSRSEDVIE